MGFPIRDLVLPPTSLCLIFLAGMLIRTRFPRMGRFLRYGSVLALYLLCTGVGVAILAGPLERQSLTWNSSAPAAQAIVVLAAGRYADAPEYDLRDEPDYVTLGRIRYAAHLQRQTGLPILVSGGNIREDRIYTSKAVSMARTLREEFGVSVQWLEDKSDNTAQNAVFTSRMLKPQGIERILLVTDAMHMPRSMMAFRESGMKPIAAPTIFQTRRALRWKDLIPAAKHLWRSEYAVHEWIGLAWYRLCYTLGRQP